jgi:hypothetical protein
MGEKPVDLPAGRARLRHLLAAFKEAYCRVVSLEHWDRD